MAGVRYAMNFRWLANLRARLLVLVAVCVLPILALLVVQAMEEYRLTVDKAYQADERVLAQVQQRLINEERRAADTLSLLGHMPELRSDSATCSRQAAVLVKKLPDFINLGTIRPNGTVRCTAVPLTKTLDVSTHAWFRSVLRAGHIAHGPFRFMGIVRQFGMVFGAPVFGPNRHLAQVIFLSMPIRVVAPDEQLLSTNDLTLTVFNSSGTVLARFPDSASLIGSSRADSPLFAAFKDANNSRRRVLPDITGRQQFYSLLKLPTGDTDTDMYLAAGVSKADTDSQALTEFLLRLADLAALTLTIMLGMWILSTYFVRRQLQAVIDTLGKIGTGDFRARSGLDHHAGEIGDLARGVSGMAEELNKLELARRASEDRYRAQIEQSVDGIVVCNKSGAILYANDAFCELCGYSRTVLLNDRIGDLLDKAGNDLLKKLTQSVPDPRPHKECMLRHSNGSLVPVECTFCNLDSQEFEVTLRDISERKQAELLLSQQKDLYQMLSQTNEAIVQTRDRGELFTKICRIVVDHGRLRLATISLVDADRAIRPAAQFGDKFGYLEHISIAADVTVPEGRGPSGRAVRTKHHVVINDFLKDATTQPWHEPARQAGIRASAAFPIVRNDVVIGLLNLYSGNPGFFTTELLHSFDQVAENISFALANYAREDDRERAIATTLRSERQFRLLVRATSEIVWIAGADGSDFRITGSWPGREELRSENLSGLQLARMIHPEDRSAVAGAWQQAKSNLTSYDLEYRLRMLNNSYRWFVVRGLPVIDDSGKVSEWIGICIDIHERKVAELELRKSRKQYQELVENSIDGIYLRNAEGRFLFVNQALCKMLDYRSEELLERSIQDLLDQDDPRLSDFFKRLSSGEKLPPFAPGRLKHRDGHWLYVESTVKQLDDGRIQAIVRDVTERKRAERELVEEQRFIMESINSIPGLFYVCDDKRRFLRWNQRFEWITGYSRSEIERMPAESIIAPGNRALMRQKIAQVFETGEADIEVNLLTRDGREIPYYFNGRSFEWQGIVCLAGVGVDVSVRKQAEQLAKDYLSRTRSLSRKLLNAQEQERHDIARELHDETGSVLTALQMNLERVTPQVPARIKPLLKENRLIVERLLSQVRRMSLDLRPSVLDDLGLVAAIRWYARERLQGENLAVQLELPASLPRLAPEIENAGFRMVQGAATNAIRHASAANLEISLSTDSTDLHLSVRDDGKGFDVAAAQTKAKGGLSLGLLAMEERVHLAGGKFSLRSAPGEGTEVSAHFRIKLRTKK